MSNRAQHVVPRGNQWSVRSSGAARVAGTFATRGEALAVARARAMAMGTFLYIHGRDGLIHERLSFGKDPAPSKA
jgi:Uncharacterized protein conserved in bacteria (DUF2188)